MQAGRTALRLAATASKLLRNLRIANVRVVGPSASCDCVEAAQEPTQSIPARWGGPSTSRDCVEAAQEPEGGGPEF